MATSTDLRPPADGFVSRFPDAFFDAIIVVSFGGPEGPDDVIPFLENVTRGRNIPRERLEVVGEHYHHFGGVSPINAQNRALIDALRAELDASGIDLPIYFGNRNWHPLLEDTLREMVADGRRRALAFFTSAFSSYSGCRQYREDVFRAQEAVGADAPEVLKLRAFWNHPGFVQANADAVAAAIASFPAERRAGVQVVFTAHSIPTAMAAGCRYEDQLAETARLVAEAVGVDRTSIVYQSRSGAPHVPWTEPDVLDHLRELKELGVEDVVVSPIGFVSDHMEVMFDLDVEAADLARELGLGFARAATAGTHPVFVGMIRELIQERLGATDERRAIGAYAASPDVCPPGCCLSGSGRPSPWERGAAPAA